MTSFPDKELNFYDIFNEVNVPKEENIHVTYLKDKWEDEDTDNL